MVILPGSIAHLLSDPYQLRHGFSIVTEETVCSDDQLDNKIIVSLMQYIGGGKYQCRATFGLRTCEEVRSWMYGRIRKSMEKLDQEEVDYEVVIQYGETKESRWLKAEAERILLEFLQETFEAEVDEVVDAPSLSSEYSRSYGGDEYYSDWE